MKAVVCELCGSNELVKEDGMFVCQYCGTKYSLEEARKLMVEATVTVSGTVKVDGIASADNLLMRAKAIEAQGNIDEAESHYYRVLDLDPENVEAKQGIERLGRCVSGVNLTADFTEGNSGQVVGVFIDGKKVGSLKGGQTHTYQLQYGKHEVGAAGGFRKCKNPTAIDIRRNARYYMRIRFKGWGVQFDVTRC